MTKRTTEIIERAAAICMTPENGGMPQPEFQELARETIARLAGHRSNIEAITAQDVNYLARVLQATGGTMNANEEVRKAEERIRVAVTEAVAELHRTTGLYPQRLDVHFIDARTYGTDADRPTVLGQVNLTVA